MPALDTQLSKLKALMAQGDYRAALKLAAGWPRLGAHKAPIERAWAALTNPEFYREIGKDPEALVAAGVAAIRERYGIPEANNPENGNEGL